MDFLEQTIQQLSADEQSEFRQFLQKRKQERKDLMLFDIIARNKDYEPRVMVGKLQTTNLNAYHSLRKRLMKELYEFVVFKQLQSDATGASSVMGFISMTRFMLQKNLPDVARYFIRKAEVSALQLRQYDLLENIYNLMIAHGDQLHTPVEETIQKWQINSKKYQARQKLNIAYTLIRLQLASARKSGTILDVEEIVTRVFREFEITIDDANTPEFMYKITSMARSAVVSAKDYHRFEPFIVRIYSRLKKTGAFTRHDFEYEIGFQYMIAHALYRNKKFDEAEKLLDGLESAENAKSLRATELYSKTIALRASIATYSGRNELAISIIRDALKNDRLRISLAERLNMTLNLSVYYFQAEEFKKANKTLIDIGHSDRWLEDKMGVEWRFKKNMIEVITQIELRHEDIALSKILSIEKHFALFFQQAAYARARIFLSFIKRLVNQPEIISSKAFAEEVINAQLAWPEEKEDLQAITFFAWLKAKMKKRNYYETLVEVMKTSDYGN
ncbi:MAG: hypothetical protein ACKVOK_09135 [Flavobacteriales bacterium]